MWIIFDSKPPPDKVPEFAVPRDTLEEQLESWVERAFDSKRVLTSALLRPRQSYIDVRAGKPRAS
jgi:hypothetical protein